MRFEKKIYNVDWQKLALMLTPMHLRKPRFTALLLACVSGVQYVYTKFIGFKFNVEYDLTITPQVCFLEKLLNDYFDYDLRRIFIRDPYTRPPLVLYKKSENIELVLKKKSEAGQVVLYAGFDQHISTDDFLIVLPTGLTADFAAMAALVKKYCLPAKNFSIIYE